jgi:carboxymethylenebutenolidase
MNPENPPAAASSAPRSSGILPAGIALAAILGAAAVDLQAAEGQNVQFEVRGESVRAYLVEDEVAAVRPGIVLVHGWWGLNEQMRGVAERVAGLGYPTIVPDLYRGRLPADLGYAHDFMRDLDENWAMQVLSGAMQQLRSAPGASRRPVGMIGFDMGGALTLTAALRGLPLQTAISFYGDTRDGRESLKALGVPFLGIFAGEDRATPPDAIERFEALLRELGKEAKIVVMPGVGRYFSNEDRPGYDPESTRGAWSHVEIFLAEHLDGAGYEQRRKGMVFGDGPVDRTERWKKPAPR